MDGLGENLKKVLLAGVGAVAVTAEKSKDLLDEMVKKGEITVEQGKVLNEELKHNIRKTMKEKQMSQYRLIRYYGFSAGQIGRLKKNMYVSTHTLEVLCQILNCRIEDIVEYIPDEEQQPIICRPE